MDAREQRVLEVAQEIKYSGSNMSQNVLFQSTMESAKALGKIAIFPITATWCGYCPSMVTSLEEAIENDPKLAERFLMRPIVAQTHTMNDGKVVPHLIESADRVLNYFMDLIGKDVGVSKLQVFSAFPRIVVIDPNRETEMRILGTGELTLSRDLWSEPRRYHDEVRVKQLLNERLSVANSCGYIFGK